MMKSLRYLACGAALIASIGASSASAANWDPPNTVLHASQVGTGTLTGDPSGATFTCVTGTTDLRVATETPATASTIAAHNPVAFSGCTTLGFPVAVTTFGVWHFTATSTTNVNVTATPGAGGRVATISIPGLGCDFSVTHTTILNNTWNNVAKTLTVNRASPFALEPSSHACGTLLGTSGTLETTFNVPGANLT